jgi:hypothetical protein
LLQAADELVKEKPELAELIEPRISELGQQFDDLERATKEKGERLFDANREVLLHQTCDDIDTWMDDLEKQIESEDTGTDLASVNILMQKQQVIHYVVPQTNCVSLFSVSCCFVSDGIILQLLHKDTESGPVASTMPWGYIWRGGGNVLCSTQSWPLLKVTGLLHALPDLLIHFSYPVKEPSGVLWI